MLKPLEKTELCQISLTGMRALTLLGLLIKSPKSLEDIKEAFLDLNIMEENSSNDIIRIDLNTLKAIGCEITRADNQTNGKFKLKKHPFDLQITTKELNVVKKIYKRLAAKVGLATLIEFDKLFKKLAEHVYNNEVREQLLGISFLKSYKLNEIQAYINDCKYNNILTIEYRNPVLSETEIKTFTAQKLDTNNEKIYLFGYSSETKDNLMLPIKRIKRVIKREINTSNVTELKPVEVEFHLRKMNAAGLMESEKILGTSHLGYTIKGLYNNDFTAVQRMLSFGAECTVISPDYIKNNVIKKLLAMREVYKDEK